MKYTQVQWAKLGRWMLFVNGLVFIALALYTGESVVSLLLRLWGGLFGIYFCYVAITS